MLTSEDFFYISQYETPVPDENRWFSVYARKGEAIEGGSNFIRDVLLNTKLPERKSKGTIMAIEEACKTKNHERAIELWNRSYPENMVKVYKGASIL